MSTEVGMGSCCLSGTVHSGTPAGREEKIAGFDTYISEPSGGDKAKTIIFFTDIFGWKFPNVRLLGDQYAKAGFYVYIPDFHDGDSLPHEFLDDIEPPLVEREKLSTIEKGVKSAKVAATLGPWVAKHREGVVKPQMDSFVDAVKKIPGTNKIGAIGFCWGGRYAILQGQGRVDAVFACHPALLSIPADFDPVNKPLTVALGDQDSLVGQSEIEKIQNLFNTKTGVPLEVKVYPDQVHGFTVRSDFSSDKDKKAMDEALQQGVSWFNKYLA